VDAAKVEGYRAERDYEGLEMYILEHLMGARARVGRDDVVERHLAVAPGAPACPS